jgi:hypothetical protein
LFGAIIGFVSAVLSAFVTQWLTTRREDRKAIRDRENERRALLREKLEEVINALMTHNSELELRIELPIPLAATLVAGAPMPWKYDEEALTAKSLVKGTTLIALYFPDLFEVVTKAAVRAAEVRKAVNAEIEIVHKRPEEWLINESNSYNERLHKLFDDYKEILLDVMLLAQRKLRDELL